MKKIRNLTLLAMASLALLVAVPQVNADVNIVGQSYSQVDGFLTLNVLADESWIVYRSVDAVNWEQVSPVMRKNQTEFTDTTAWTDYYPGVQCWYVVKPKPKGKPTSNIVL